ncbi:MAG: peptidoglycan DD-metalloendopeptidase family protein [Vibrionaceae bacterium]
MVFEQFATLPQIHKFSISGLSAAIVLMILWPAPDSYSTLRPQFEIGKHYPIDMQVTSLLPAKSQKMVRSLAAELNWQHFTIESGQSLATIFSSAQISPATLHQLINSSEQTQRLSKLKVRDKISLGFDEDSNFVQLRFKKSAKETLVVTRINNNFVTSEEKRTLDTQVNFASATIESNFWNAGITAGLDHNQIMELANLFAWDIDFALDIRKGDSFKVLFEERWMEGDYVGRGNILAAVFVNQGETFTAVRDKSGHYYAANGQAMRKAFLRAPVDFRYVSSNFNPKRLHPVTGELKAHRGTDYVAPVGTPIWAAGNGLVLESSYNKFNGHYVVIRHSETYVTKYLHLHTRSVKKGERVRQGQAIGTLGGSGRVTGAHLHYEFLVNGVHKNPRTVKLPQALSLEGKDRQEFLRNAQQYLAQLDKFDQLFAYSNPLKNSRL